MDDKEIIIEIKKSDVDYAKLMRKYTREIHSVSDALVNAKLAFAISNNKVWAEGLLIFYEVFKFLENAIKTTENKHLRQFYIEEMFRTEAFEEDLIYYLGPTWKINYLPRISVRRYLNYLGKLERNEPELLIAFVYHLYMGLLSGGQILAKKRSVLKKICLADNNQIGNAVTTFTVPIGELKQKIRALVNEVCAKIESLDMREKLIKEGRMVFKLNNEIVGSIEKANSVIYKKLFISIAVLTASYLVIRYFK